MDTKQSKSLYKRIINMVITVIMVGTLICLVAVTFSLVSNKDNLGAATLLGYKPLVITSGSMEHPDNRSEGIMTHAIILDKQVDFDDINIDDIITFEREDHLVTHRVVDIMFIDGEKHVQTKGDNNPQNDPFTITREEYRFKTVAVWNFTRPIVDDIYDFGINQVNALGVLKWIGIMFLLILLIFGFSYFVKKIIEILRSGETNDMSILDAFKWKKSSGDGAGSAAAEPAAPPIQPQESSSAPAPSANLQDILNRINVLETSLQRVKADISEYLSAQQALANQQQNTINAYGMPIQPEQPDPMSTMTNMQAGQQSQIGGAAQQPRPNAAMYAALMKQMQQNAISQQSQLGGAAQQPQPNAAMYAALMKQMQQNATINQQSQLGGAAQQPQPSAAMYATLMKQAQQNAAPPAQQVKQTTPAQQQKPVVTEDQFFEDYFNAMAMEDKLAPKPEPNPAKDLNPFDLFRMDLEK